MVSFLCRKASKVKGGERQNSRHLVVGLVDGGKAALANVADNDIGAEFVVASKPPGRCCGRRCGRGRGRWIHGG